MLRFNRRTSSGEISGRLSEMSMGSLFGSSSSQEQIRRMSLEMDFRKYYSSLCNDMDHSTLTEYSLKEVLQHDTIGDVWIVLFNHVYNITSLLYKHPGGMEVLLENAGRDASLVFLESGHGNVPLSILKPYLVGVLPKEEHLKLPYPEWKNRIAELSQILD